MRKICQNYTFAYGEPMPVEQLVHRICDYKQQYTQHGGLRPFGVSILYASWDPVDGFALFNSDPSGNYSSWKAIAIGAAKTAGSAVLKECYKDEVTLHDALVLGAKVITKSLDTTAPDPERVELTTLSIRNGKPTFRSLSNEEVQVIIQDVVAAAAS
jgi:20S proteasome subunit alpha 3